MLSRRGLPLRAVVICVAAGALLNIAIAWVCALRLDADWARLESVDQTGADAPDDLETLRTHAYAQRYSDAEVWLGVERLPGVERRVAFVMPYWEAAAARLPRPQSRGQRFVIVNDLHTRIHAGWPLVALHGERWIDMDAHDRWSGSITSPHNISGLYIHRGLLPIAMFDRSQWKVGGNAISESFPHLLPLKPVWSGFLVNTTLYATIVWSLLFAPFAARRALRRRRNVCERCAYPRGISNVCSECGAALL